MEDADTGAAGVDRGDPVRGNSLRIQDAITDAQILVEYSARAGIAVSPGVVETLITAETRRSEGGDPDFAIEFWDAFRKICSDIKPVTITSIRTTLLEPDRHIAKRTIRRYTFWTMALLVVVLTIQVYWLIGRTLADRTTNLIEQGERINTDILLANRDWDQMAAIFQAKEDEARLMTSTQGAEAATSNGLQLHEYAFYTSADFEQAIIPIEHRQLDLQTNLENTRTELDRNAKLLTNWSRVWSRIFLAGIDEDSYEDSQRDLRQRISEVNESITELDKMMSAVDLEIKPEAVAEKEDERASLVAIKDELTLQLQQDQRDVSSRIIRLSSEFVLITLNGYVLPLLYGLLGASVYVLRAVKREISNVTFTNDTGQGYFFRLSLGMLAGLFIGWFTFLIPGQSVINSLSPLALAFLVGYNVEIIFSLMDKVIGAVKNYEIDDDGVDGQAASPNAPDSK